MIALDTNALLRWIVGDDAAQHKKIVAALDQATRKRQRVFIAEIVIVETLWVLRRSYKLTHVEAANALKQLLSASLLVIENEALIAQALLAYSRGHGDFSDYLIREHARAAGATPLLTFDETLLADTDFESP
ncbi:PIN domain-containing protein [Hydrocarboniphaga sp.]|uniref:PIN domain-containing protein n=1 Tax=Hydrocarboniphaga sp. TaxID=2033016 RepID=UPI003D0BF17C